MVWVCIQVKLKSQMPNAKRIRPYKKIPAAAAEAEAAPATTKYD